MDFSKFVDLMFSSELHFARADLLGDPFEGALPYTHEKAWVALLEASQSEDRAERMPTGWARFRHEQIVAIKNMLHEHGRTLREMMFISCWHMNEFESAGMWNCYSKTNESVCVQTRYNLLSKALPEFCFLGIVKYLNYDIDFINEENLFFRFLRKSKSFEHEREIRSILVRISGSDNYEDDRIRHTNEYSRLKIELSSVFENIYVNPGAPKWFANLVEQVVARAGLAIPVRQSSLARDPLF